MGNDEFAIEGRIKMVYSAISDPTLAQMTVSRMDMANVEIKRAREEAYAMPFMASERFVVMDNVFSPLAVNTSKETLRLWQEEFLEFLTHLPLHTHLFLVQVERNAPSKEFENGMDSWVAVWAKINEAHFKIERYLLPNGNSERMQWLMAEAKRHGIKFNNDAIEQINQYAGDLFDTRVLAQEVAKLAAYVNYSRPITAKDVLEVGISNEHYTIFPLVDAIGNKNTDLAIKLYRGLLEDKDPEEIFPMIIRQFRLIIQAKYAREHSIPVNTISGMASTFVSSKVVPQAANFRFNQLKNYYAALVEIEETVKSTAITLEGAIELFIIRSCAGAAFPKNFLCTPPRPPRTG